MQLIQNQMKEQNQDGDCQSCSKANNIDPELLQQIFSIDQEEEECSETSEEDDDDDYNEEEEGEDEEEETMEDIDEEMMQQVSSFDLNNPGIIGNLTTQAAKTAMQAGVYFGNKAQKDVRKKLEDYASSDDDDDNYCNKMDLL